MDTIQHLKIPLEKIILATNNFDKENLIAKGGSGNVYKGELSWSDGLVIEVAVKRLDPESTQGTQDFIRESTLLSTYRHKNIVSLVGFCDEDKEKVLVFEYESKKSLDGFISNLELNWMMRLQISIGVARGLNYLHHELGNEHRVLHRDIKSANILLNKDWEAKLSDFGLSKIALANTNHTFLVTNAAGTFGYLDPSYYKTGVLTKESDVYSFGVVLFEILCGRLAFAEGVEGSHVFLGPLAKREYEEDTLDEIIIPNLRKQMSPNSLNIFATIAYQCLNTDRRERPTMGQILEELEDAYDIQVSDDTEKIVRVGIWGTKSFEDPKNQWSFRLWRNHHLKKITIDHGDFIYSLMFTTEFRGLEQTLDKAGCWNGGEMVSEVTFAWDEEIIAISGTVGISKGTYTTISSLTIITNKQTHGPYGNATGTPFTVPWDKGSFAGFYGFASHYIHGIGVYLKGICI